MAIKLYFFYATLQPCVTQMAYMNSYPSGEWPAAAWPDSGQDWQNSAMTYGGSPESSSVSRPQSHLSEETSAKAGKSSITGSPSQGHWEPYPAASHPHQSGPSTSMDTTYYSNYSEASSASYIPATTDDSYYYNGDMTSYDMGPMASPPSAEYMHQDYDNQYEMPEPQSPDSSRRKSSSNPSSKVVSSPYPLTSHLSTFDQHRKQKRQLQNRLAQRAFRERQAKQQEELHKKVRHLKEEYQNLEHRYQQLAQDHEKCNQRDGHRRDCTCQSSR